MLHKLKNFLLFCHDIYPRVEECASYHRAWEWNVVSQTQENPSCMLEKYSNAPHGVLWGGITANNCAKLNFSGGPISGTTRLLILKNVLMPMLRIGVRQNCRLLIALSARDFLKGNFSEPRIGRGSPAFPSTSTVSTHSFLDPTGLKIVGILQSECGCKSVHTNKHLLKQPTPPLHKWGYGKYHLRPEDTSDPLGVMMELTIRVSQLFPLGVEPLERSWLNTNLALKIGFLLCWRAVSGSM